MLANKKKGHVVNMWRRHRRVELRALWGSGHAGLRRSRQGTEKGQEATGGRS